MDLRTLQRALGGEISAGQLLCPGPGHSRKDRSLAVRLSGNDGFVVHSHSGDDWAECRDFVREKLGLPPWQPGDEQRRTIPQRHTNWDFAAVEAEANEGPRQWSKDELSRIAWARCIWEQSRDPRGTLAERYLHERSLNLPDELAGPVLRFHRGCPWRDENAGGTIYVPALIAAFRSIDDDAVTAVHRIALTDDGAKIGRRMLGVVHRSAVKLDPAGDLLAIGEGVETCLAARQMSYSPVWALGSTGNITRFPAIDGIKCLRILGETGEASARAVRLCGRRWHKAGRRVQLVQPNDGCSDLNDELMLMAAADRGRTAAIEATGRPPP